jgi:biopolymer transport protein ExbB
MLDSLIHPFPLLTVITQFGGIVAVPLLALSLLSLSAIGERCWFWWQITHRQDLIVRQALQMIQANGPAATDLLRQNLNLPIARVFLEALELDRPTPSEFALALETAARAELVTLRRFSTLFETIVTTAPLLGLLGTVLGLIQSFGGLQLGDPTQNDPTAITAGIGIALSSTVFGLVVAIVTLFFANGFRSLYRRQRANLEEYGGRLELIYRRYCRQYPANTANTPEQLSSNVKLTS